MRCRQRTAGSWRHTSRVSGGNKKPASRRVERPQPPTASLHAAGVISPSGGFGGPHPQQRTRYHGTAGLSTLPEIGFASGVGARKPVWSARSFGEEEVVTNLSSNSFLNRWQLVHRDDPPSGMRVVAGGRRRLAAATPCLCRRGLFLRGRGAYFGVPRRAQARLGAEGRGRALVGPRKGVVALDDLGKASCRRHQSQMRLGTRARGGALRDRLSVARALSGAPGIARRPASRRRGSAGRHSSSRRKHSSRLCKWF